MDFRITTLVENTVPTSVGMIGEHGLSFLIETDGRKILFDTGQGMAVVNNLTRTGHSPRDIETVVLSHGHYDHTGGLKSLIGAGAKFELIAHPDIFTKKVAPFPGKGVVPIGMPVTMDELADGGIFTRLEKEAYQISPGITTTGEIPQLTDYEKIEPVLMVMENGKVSPDPLSDDQALVLDTEKGIVLLLGCTHRGLVNTLNHVADLTGGKQLHAIIGGLHLERSPESQIESTIDALRVFDPKMIAVTHCTGTRAVVPLINVFGSKVMQASVGTVMNF